MLLVAPVEARRRNQIPDRYAEMASFNVRGEPIVYTPLDAYACFMRTDMDYLAIGNFVFDKKQQPEWQEKTDWRQSFVLD